MSTLKIATKPPFGGRDYSLKINSKGDNMKKYLIKKETCMIIEAGKEV